MFTSPFLLENVHFATGNNTIHCKFRKPIMTESASEHSPGAVSCPSWCEYLIFDTQVGLGIVWALEPWTQLSYLMWKSRLLKNWFWICHWEKVFSSVQSLSCVPLFVTPWTSARQASLSITNSWSLLKFMSTELVMPSNHLILCRPLLLPPTIFPSIRIISSDSVLHNQVTKILEFQLQHQSFQGIFRTDFL